MNAFNGTEFLQWFKGAGGWYDEKYIGLKPFSGMGYGAVALESVPEDIPLFHIPDSLILSSHSSELSKHLTEEEWEKLNHGWCQLILCMMWESERGIDSPWSGYLANMPVEFDTPMLWDEDERKELIGTDIEDRIGKEDAEQEYNETLLPIIKAHPELFPESSQHHSLSSFHLHGSRILSRSFTVPLLRFTRLALEPQNNNDNGDDESDFSDDDDDEYEEDGEEIAVMIPFADMLNAAYERDNANLYTNEKIKKDTPWTKKGFTMKSTKLINKDEQIYNTYASPPNSELLRKYGHVDILPLPQELIDLLKKEDQVDGEWYYGNPGDEVLIDGTAIVESVKKVLGKDKINEKWESKISKRVDWWLEEGQEDMFPLTLSPEIDEALIGFIRLLLYDHEWLRAKKKNKLPTTTIDNDVAAIIVDAIQNRLSKYSGDIQSDLVVIKSIKADHIPRPSASTALPTTIEGNEEISTKQLRKCYAAIVRLGEKRILHSALKIAEGHLPQKRKAEDDGKA
ncbi:uncharacterized protein L201_000517 [Kwoniella dendrophila CBS 6074]|uniref:Rubisco LSMT substrate-binding domain-containing protein n=1 Tax=Kwoniella dendrophila CBS 6074 TaxID=1295534 RepID=A0AAX4JJQ9_9TREE